MTSAHEKFFSDIKVQHGIDIPEAEQIDFLTIAATCLTDLRMVHRLHTDRQMVKTACLHFLGDDAQSWWQNRNGVTIDRLLTDAKMKLKDVKSFLGALTSEQLEQEAIAISNYDSDCGYVSVHIIGEEYYDSEDGCFPKSALSDEDFAEYMEYDGHLLWKADQVLFEVFVDISNHPVIENPEDDSTSENIKRLTGLAFWDDLRSKCPLQVQIFFDWFDRLSSTAKWAKSFEGSEYDKKSGLKFEYFPHKMQMWIWIEFLKEKSGSHIDIKNVYDYGLDVAIRDFISGNL